MLAGGIYYLSRSSISADIADLSPKGETPNEARKYLNALKAKIGSNYWNDYILSSNAFGLDGQILKNISPSSSQTDYEAFTRARAQVFNFIAYAIGSDLRAPMPKTNHTQTLASLVSQRASAGQNLLSNGGFEEISNQAPLKWEDKWKAGGNKSIDTNTKHSGNNSWKFAQEDTTHIQGALSGYIAVQTDVVYEFSAWIKAPKKTEIAVSWYEYEKNDGKQSFYQMSQIGLGSNRFFQTQANSWQKLTSGIRVKDKNTKYIKIKIANFKGDVWWDDLALTDAGSDYLTAFGCQNNNESKCIDVGSQDESQGGNIVGLNEMGNKETDGNTSFRSLNPKSAITAEIPSFNVNSSGLPETPMMLEIRYKDTLNYSSEIKKSESADKATVFSKIGYISKNPILYGYRNKGTAICNANNPNGSESDNCYPNDKEFYSISALGDIGDGKWKYIQYPILQNELPMLRSIDGKLTLKIQMPLTGPNNVALPIDYIAIRIASDKNIADLNQKQREIRGMYEVDFKSPNQDNLADPTIFASDIMRPVYPGTIPDPKDTTSNIASFSTLGEIEPASFGIYSKAGIKNLNIELTDLKNSTGETIPKNNISPYLVKNNERRLLPEGFGSYTNYPDHIENFSAHDLSAKISEKIYLKTKIPASLKGGKYSGKITLKTDSQKITEINYEITILPIKLDSPKAVNYVFGDPVNRVYVNDIDKLFNLYNDYKLTTLLFLHKDEVGLSGSGGATTVDLTKFEKRLDIYISKSIIKPKQPINVRSIVSTLYKHVYPDGDLNEQALYSKMTADEFQKPYSNLIQKLMAIAQERNIEFIFETVDEPNTNQKRITADRLSTIIKKLNGKTSAPITIKSESPLDAQKLKPFVVPSENLPLQPLSASSILDYGVWNLSIMGERFKEKKWNGFSYYTTRTDYTPGPLNHRFLDGLLAFKTDAESVYDYGAQAWWNDPYRDFDARTIYYNYVIEPDRLFAYPTYSGELLPTLSGEGIREGIKDSQYIATLENLLAGGSPSSSPSPAPGVSETPSVTPVSPPPAETPSTVPPTPPVVEAKTSPAESQGDASTANNILKNVIGRVLGPATASRILSVAGIKSGISTIYIAAVAGILAVLTLITIIVWKKRKGAKNKHNETPAI